MKKLLKTLLITILILIIPIMLLVIVVDPFYHYHKPFNMDNVYLYNEKYQSPGIARNFSYDSIMIGSSMTENFKPSMFTAYSEDALVVSYAGARSLDLGNLISEAFESNNTIKRVYVDINDYQLCSDPQSQLDSEIGYLYDSNILTDVQYIFNIDVIVECLDRLFDSDRESNLDEAFTWDDPSLFGKEKVLEDLQRNHESQAWVQTDGSYDDSLMDIVLENIKNIDIYVDSNPETKFVFFFPPYSIAYWYDLKEQNRLDEKLDMYSYAINSLLRHPNTEVFFFMDDYEVITNLDLYRDLCHFAPNVNSLLLEYLHDGTYQIDADTAENRINNLKEYVLDYNF